MVDLLFKCSESGMMRAGTTRIVYALSGKVQSGYLVKGWPGTCYATNAVLQDHSDIAIF